MRQDFAWLQLRSGLPSAVFQTTKLLARSSDITKTDVGEILAKECDKSSLRNATGLQSTVLGMAEAFLTRLQHGSKTLEFDDDSLTVLVDSRSRLGFVNEWPSVVDWKRFGDEEGVDRGVYDLVLERVHWKI